RIGASVEAMTPTTTRAPRLEIHRGDAALALIERPAFRHAWRSLHEACPWSTAFQDVPFAETWYRSYRTRFAPVVVAGWTDAMLPAPDRGALSRDQTGRLRPGVDAKEGEQEQAQSPGAPGKDHVRARGRRRRIRDAPGPDRAALRAAPGCGPRCAAVPRGPHE